MYRYIKLTRILTVDGTGSGGASVNMNESVMIDVRCKYQLTMQLPADAGINASSSVMVDSVVFVPDYRHSDVYADAGKSK